MTLLDIAYWLKKHFPNPMKPSQMNSVENIISLLSLAAYSRYIDYTPEEWMRSLGKLLYLRHKNFVAHLMILWAATGDHLDPVPYEKYMAIKHDHYEDVIMELINVETYSVAVSICSRHSN